MVTGAGVVSWVIGRSLVEHWVNCMLQQVKKEEIMSLSNRVISFDLRHATLEYIGKKKSSERNCTGRACWFGNFDAQSINDDESSD